MNLSSTAFDDGHALPVRYTCDGDNVSPPLRWNAAPSPTKSFALICEDPDAPLGNWVHWLLYDVPAATEQLPEHVDRNATLPTGAKQGITDFKRSGYGGPCPPPGKAHHYRFKLFALDTELKLAPATTRNVLLKAMAGHVLAEASLTGVYQRTAP